MITYWYHSPHGFYLQLSRIDQIGSFFSCDLAALWMVQSVRPPARPPARLSHRFHYVPIIITSWNFISYYQWQNEDHAKGQGQSSKLKVTYVETLLSRFQTVTPIVFKGPPSNFKVAQDNKLPIISIEEVTYCFPKPSIGLTGQKVTNFDPNWAFPDCNSSLNSPMALK